MTTSSFEQRRRQSSTFTTIITVIALLSGWGLKTFTEGQTRPITVKGITARVPARWIVRQADTPIAPSDDPFQMAPPGSAQNPHQVFTAWNPLHPERRYTVSAYPGGADLPSTAAVRALNQGQKLRLYRVLNETPILVSGKEGYKVSFAYVDAGDIGEIPVVIQGIDYYFTSGEQILVITLEVENDNPADHLTDFLKFLETVQAGG
jgi:hypothetical protein